MIAGNHDGGRSSLGAQCVRFTELISDLIPAKRNEILRNTRKTGRSVGDPPHDPCPPPENPRRNHEEPSEPRNPD